MKLKEKTVKYLPIALEVKNNKQKKSWSLFQSLTSLAVSLYFFFRISTSHSQTRSVPRLSLFLSIFFFLISPSLSQTLSFPRLSLSLKLISPFINRGLSQSLMSLPLLNSHISLPPSCPSYYPRGKQIGISPKIGARKLGHGICALAHRSYHIRNCF